LEDWAKLIGNLLFKNVPPLTISLGESDSKSNWDFDDDSEYSNEIMEVEWFCSFFV
jgi:hypothetical protein